MNTAINMGFQDGIILYFQVAKKTASLVVNIDDIWHKLEIQLLNIPSVTKCDGKRIEGDSCAYVKY